MTENDFVDMEARSDIKVLQHQVGYLHDAVMRHMEYEEQQRDRMERRLDSIWRRMNLLTMSIVGGAGAVGGFQYIPGILGA